MTEIKAAARDVARAECKRLRAMLLAYADFVNDLDDQTEYLSDSISREALENRMAQLTARLSSIAATKGGR